MDWTKLDYSASRHAFAPFDGTHILLKLSTGVNEAHWVSLTQPGRASALEESGWQDQNGRVHPAVEFYWRPLPDKDPLWKPRLLSASAAREMSILLQEGGPTQDSMDRMLIKVTTPGRWPGWLEARFDTGTDGWVGSEGLVHFQEHVQAGVCLPMPGFDRRPKPLPVLGRVAGIASPLWS